MGKGFRNLLGKNDRVDTKLVEEFRGADAEHLSYDYFKGLTSLSVLTLGGVLTLSETAFAQDISAAQMLIAGGLIAGGGIIALQCQSDIVQVARGAKTHAPWLNIGHRLAPALFGGGIGAFLAMLVGAYI